MGVSLETKYKQLLVGNHSIAKVHDVAQLITSKKDIQALLNLIHPSHDYPTPEAAAWCIRHASDHLKKHHKFISEEIIKPLSEFDRDSLIKNILGTLKVITISKNAYGSITDYCLNYLTQPTRSKAVLYYSAEVMTKICKDVPELTREFIMILDELHPYSSDAFMRKQVKIKAQLIK